MNKLLIKPGPGHILAYRLRANLTQADAGALVGMSLRGWQDGEYGKTRMHPATYTLFLLATHQHPAYTLKAR